MGRPPSLLVVSHVVHYRQDGALFAYGPYALEIEVWARMFRRVLIAAPCRMSAAPEDCRRFSPANIDISPLPETGGRGAGAKLRQLALLPKLAWRLAGLLRGCDVAQVRCPGNVGLLGVLLAPLLCRRMIAKYAGQWSAYPDEPWSFRLQRRLLASRWWRGPVLVYGEGRGAPPQVVPFFNSALTRQQMDRAIRAARRPRPSGGPRRLLFIGRLSRAKGADIAVECCARLASAGLNVELEIAGEGPERDQLERQVDRLNVRDRVRLHGGCSFEQVLSFYEQADVLVLPSLTEGWPKVLAEAMAFGVPCVATACGLNPWILGEGRGLTAPRRDIAAFTAAVRRLLEEPPAERESRRQACAAWGQRYSLEDVEQGLRSTMERFWGAQWAGGAP